MVDTDGQVIGLLTERDLLIVSNEHPNGLGKLTVGKAHLRDGAERLLFLRPEASRDDVAAALREPQVVAVLVTPDGSPRQRPLGIITAADLLLHT